MNHDAAQHSIHGDIAAQHVSGQGIAMGHGATAIVTIYQHVLRAVPLAYRTTTDEQRKRDLLTILAPYLSAEHVPETLDRVRTIIDEQGRSTILTLLIPHIPAASLLDTLDTIKTLTNIGWRAESLIMVLHCLPDGHRTDLAAETLTLIRSVKHVFWRAELLTALAVQLPADQQHAIHAEVIDLIQSRAQSGMLLDLLPYLASTSVNAMLACADTIGRANERSDLLVALLPYLADAQRESVCAQVLDLLDSGDSSWNCATILIALAPFASFDIMVDMLDRVPMLDEDIQAETLTALAPFLPEQMLRAACKMAVAVTDASLRAELLVSLAARWPPEDAAPIVSATLTAIGAIRSEGERVSILSRLAPLFPTERPVDIDAILCTFTNETLLTEAMLTMLPYLPAEARWAMRTRAATITHGRMRSRVLAGLVPYVPHEHQVAIIHEALASAQCITDIQAQSEVLAALVPHLPATRRPLVATQVFQMARRVDEPGWHASLIRRLIGDLPPDIMPDLIDLVESLPFASQQADCLITLIPVIPESFLPRIIDLTDRIPDPGWRAEVLTMLVHQMTGDQQARAYADLQRTLVDLRDPGWRAEILVALSTGMAPHEQVDLQAQAIRDIFDIADRHRRVERLLVLIPYLSRPVLSHVLERIRTLTVESLYAAVLKALVPVLAEADLPNLLAGAATISEDASIRADVLLSIAARWPATVLADLLTVTRSVTHPGQRAALLAELLACVPDSQRGDIARAALADARTIGNHYQRAMILITVTAHALPNQRQRFEIEALVAMRTIADPVQRAEALTRLALSGSDDISEEALAAVQSIESEADCVRLLGMLAPALPVPRRIAVYREALLAACLLRDPAKRVDILMRLAEPVRTSIFQFAPATERSALWNQIIRVLAGYGRPEFLSNLAVLIPCLANLTTPDDLSNIAQSMSDVYQCWP